ncbi:probable serine/threonine-protein kinase clkA [Stomoxys calcitrans]|uniref:probable serine/threonine-protein kinase clkA n=1 Tax=Stomoxys calcitrans TaxID=35570 RepID=UPI0027E2D207|nr:probable serine/threonine-protein kinase clkA [Stomoxys calcitrans]
MQLFALIIVLLCGLATLHAHFITNEVFLDDYFGGFDNYNYNWQEQSDETRNSRELNADISSKSFENKDHQDGDDDDKREKSSEESTSVVASFVQPNDEKNYQNHNYFSLYAPAYSYGNLEDIHKGHSNEHLIMGHDDSEENENHNSNSNESTETNLKDHQDGDDDDKREKSSEEPTSVVAGLIQPNDEKNYQNHDYFSLYAPAYSYGNLEDNHDDGEENENHNSNSNESTETDLKDHQYGDDDDQREKSSEESTTIVASLIQRSVGNNDQNFNYYSFYAPSYSYGNLEDTQMDHSNEHSVRNILNFGNNVGEQDENHNSNSNESTETNLEDKTHLEEDGNSNKNEDEQHHNVRPLLLVFPTLFKAIVSDAHSDESTETPTADGYEASLEYTTDPSPHPERTHLLMQLSKSSSNVDLLANEFAENIAEFKLVYGDTNLLLSKMQEGMARIQGNFENAANSNTDYNGDEHKTLMNNIANMLTKIDETRSRVMDMQSAAQRLNYHRLLEALLQEIYVKDKSTDYYSYNTQYSRYSSSYIS